MKTFDDNLGRIDSQHTWENSEAFLGHHSSESYRRFNDTDDQELGVINFPHAFMECCRYAFRAVVSSAKRVGGAGHSVWAYYHPIQATDSSQTSSFNNASSSQENYSQRAASLGLEDFLKVSRLYKTK